MFYKSDYENSDWGWTFDPSLQVNHVIRWSLRYKQKRVGNVYLDMEATTWSTDKPSAWFVELFPDNYHTDRTNKDAWPLVTEANRIYFHTISDTWHWLDAYGTSRLPNWALED